MSMIMAAATAFLVAQMTMPTEYTMVCRSDEATGMNWRNGQWGQTDFVAITRLVVAKRENTCLLEMDPEVREFGSVTFRDVCLNIREIGEPYEAVNSRVCTEVSLTNPTPHVQIQCYNSSTSARFIVDGRYSYSSIAGVLTDPAPAEGRDSIFVEVGRCSLA